MNRLVRSGSKPGVRWTSNFTPTRRRTLRKNTRCGRSFFLGSIKTAMNMTNIQTIKKCTPLTVQRTAERIMSHAFFMRRLPSYANVQDARKNFEALALELRGFAVDHHINWTIKLEFDATDAGAGSQRVVDVSSVEKGVEIFDQADAAYGSPADVFNKAVVSRGVGRDVHFAAGVFAIREGEEEATAGVDIGVEVDAQRKGAAIEAREANGDGGDVAGRAEEFEVAVGNYGDVGGEAESEQIDVIHFAGGMSEMNYVATAAFAGGESRGCCRSGVDEKVFEEGVAGAKGEEAEGGACVGCLGSD